MASCQTIWSISSRVDRRHWAVFVVFPNDRRRRDRVRRVDESGPALHKRGVVTKVPSRIHRPLDPFHRRSWLTPAGGHGACRAPRSVRTLAGATGTTRSEARRSCETTRAATRGHSSPCVFHSLSGTRCQGRDTGQGGSRLFLLWSRGLRIKRTRDGTLFKEGKGATPWTASGRELMRSETRHAPREATRGSQIGRAHV